MCLQGLMISKLSASLLLVILSFVTSTLVGCGSVRSPTMVLQTQQPVYLQDLWSLAHPTTIINKSH